MKLTSLISIFLLLIYGCGKDQAKQDQQDDSRFYVDGAQSSKSKNIKYPHWVDVGVECYGIVQFNISNDYPTSIPVKCKIIEKRNNAVKCEVVEAAQLYEKLGCEKLGVKKGETWWESSGELYKNRKEVIDTLKARKLYYEMK